MSIETSGRSRTSSYCPSQFKLSCAGAISNDRPYCNLTDLLRNSAFWTVNRQTETTGESAKPLYSRLNAQDFEKGLISHLNEFFSDTGYWFRSRPLANVC
jgi:hypothetical protein